MYYCNVHSLKANGSELELSAFRTVRGQLVVQWRFPDSLETHLTSKANTTAASCKTLVPDHGAGLCGVDTFEPFAEGWINNTYIFNSLLDGSELNIRYGLAGMPTAYQATLSIDEFLEAGETALKIDYAAGVSNINSPFFIGSLVSLGKSELSATYSVHVGNLRSAADLVSQCEKRMRLVNTIRSK